MQAGRHEEPTLTFAWAPSVETLDNATFVLVVHPPDDWLVLETAKLELPVGPPS